MAQQLEHLVQLGGAVNALVAGDESGFCPEQLRAVRDLVAKLNDDRRVPCRSFSIPRGYTPLCTMCTAVTGWRNARCKQRHPAQCNG